MILSALGKGTAASILYPEFVGRRGIFVGIGTGPASYSQTTGDPVSLAQVPLYIDAIPGGVMTVSGNYKLSFQPSGTGVRQAWAARWFYAGGGIGLTGLTIADGGTGYTSGVYTVAVTGGGGTGGTVTLTVAGGIITAATIATPGTGYTSVPTVPLTALGAGTDGSVTASIGQYGGTQVYSGTNLSAESVQVGLFIGQY